MDLIFIMKTLAVIGIVLNIVLMAWKTVTLGKTPEGKANIDFGKQPKNLICTSIVGFVANFFDTLGIGSFAPSASAFKLTKSVDDMLVPGVLNVGDTVPVCLEAWFFFAAFNVDPLTCFLMCAVATVGAFVSASIVSTWDRTKVRWGFGAGLFVLAFIMLAKYMKWGPFAGVAPITDTSVIGQVIDGVKYAFVPESGATAADEAKGIIGYNNQFGVIAGVGLTGGKLVIALIINFILGAAMSLGVGLYAPCMALCVLVGLHTGMAFPIMMGSCAYLMAFGNGPKFIMAGRYDIVACWTQAIFGAIGVYVAAVFVKSLPLSTLTILVIVVCFITSILYFKDAIAGSKKAA